MAQATQKIRSVCSQRAAAFLAVKQTAPAVAGAVCRPLSLTLALGRAHGTLPA